MQTKAQLRTQLRAQRSDHVKAQSDSIRALLFHRPPAPLLEKIGPDAIIGLYQSTPEEAPTAAYAKHFLEAGHAIALPSFTAAEAQMQFRQHADPYEHGDLERGAFGIMQPAPSAKAVVPGILFVPLIGFTADGVRLGQGGGHYDRWLAANPGRMAIGLAWDVQLCDELPQEPHDIALDAVVTPTRLYGPF